MYIDSSNGKNQLSLPFSSWRANCCECDAVFSPEGGQEITTHLDSAEKKITLLEKLFCTENLS